MQTIPLSDLKSHRGYCRRSHIQRGPSPPGFRSSKAPCLRTLRNASKLYSRHRHSAAWNRSHQGSSNHWCPSSSAALPKTPVGAGNHCSGNWKANELQGAVSIESSTNSTNSQPHDRPQKRSPSPHLSLVRCHQSSTKGEPQLIFFFELNSCVEYSSASILGAHANQASIISSRTIRLLATFN